MSYPQHRQPKSQVRNKTLIYLIALNGVLYCTAAYVTAMSLFNANYAERDGARLIATSNYNYAILSPALASKNWRTISVNGDRVMIITGSGQRQMRSRASLGPDMMFVESLRDSIAEGNSAFSSMSMSTGGGSGFVSSSAMGSSGGGSSFSVNGMAVSMTDSSTFSVSKEGLPFNWQRVFYNGDIVTVITRRGDVYMQPMSTMPPAELQALNELKEQVLEMQRGQAQQFQNTMATSTNMISSIFNGIMGQMSNMMPGMGAGSPFGGGNGAFAFAGR